MATKLVSANMGIVLIVERDGKQETVKFSVVCPSSSVPALWDMFESVFEFVNEEFASDLRLDGIADVEIVKPKKIKARKPISHNEFNRRIKELVSD